VIVAHAGSTVTMPCVVKKESQFGMVSDSEGVSRLPTSFFPELSVGFLFFVPGSALPDVLDQKKQKKIKKKIELSSAYLKLPRPKLL
jgi:hypothetical protein